VVLDKGLKFEIVITLLSQPGEEFTILNRENPALNPGETGRVLEFFRYFDDSPIERFEDVYGRK
jgi:hypothetical protein